MQENQGGVPLEHLITCVPGVNIATAQNGVKVVKWIHNKPPPPNTGRSQALVFLSHGLPWEEAVGFYLVRQHCWSTTEHCERLLWSSENWNYSLKCWRSGRTRLFGRTSVKSVKKSKAHISQLRISLALPNLVRLFGLSVDWPFKNHFRYLKEIPLNAVLPLKFVLVNGSDFDKCENRFSFQCKGPGNVNLALGEFLSSRLSLGCRC